jgi:hypothetical protein
LKNWSEGEPVFKEFPAGHHEVVPSQKGCVIRSGDGDPYNATAPQLFADTDE